MKRFIIEFGMGVDLHGQDVNDAAEKAIKDAISHSCLCGLHEVLDIKDTKEKVITHVTLATSRPDDIDIKALEAKIPMGKPDVKVTQGGLKMAGLYAPWFGDKDESVEVVIAAVEVEILD